MKISLTINLGNYNSLKVESSERENLSDCLTEVRDMILAYAAVKHPFNTPKTEEDRETQKILSKYVSNLDNSIELVAGWRK